VLLGISDEIHAGIVGGLIGALAVLIGVLVTEWMIRLRNRQARVVEAAAELQLLLPHVTLPISQLWIGDRPDTSYGSEWARRRDQVNRLALRIERDARWPVRNADEIRESAVDTLARVWAMTDLWHGSQSLATPDQHRAVWAGQPSRKMTKQRQPPLDHRMQSYREQFRKERAETP
jgi:hypothetical protein